MIIGSWNFSDEPPEDADDLAGNDSPQMEILFPWNKNMRRSVWAHQYLPFQ
jgi:hypothetical protein